MTGIMNSVVCLTGLRKERDTDVTLLFVMDYNRFTPEYPNAFKMRESTAKVEAKRLRTIYNNTIKIEVVTNYGMVSEIREEF
jgi:hypothetical protein